MLFAVMMFILFIARGLNAVFIKQAQEDQVKSFSDALLFTILFAFFQMVTIFLLPPYRPLHFDWVFLIYPLLFSVFFFLCYILMMKALDTGPVGISNAIFAFYVIIPILAGFFFFHEGISLWQIFGIVLFVACVILLNFGSYSDKNGPKQGRLSGKWFLYIIGATVASGLSTLVSKFAMAAAPEMDKEYLLYYNVIVVLIGIPILLIRRKKLTQLMKSLRFLGVTLGAAVTQNVGNLIFVMYVSTVSAATLMPLMGVLNIVSVLIAGRFFFKEKISKTAYVGLALSVVAIVLLNL